MSPARKNFILFGLVFSLVPALIWGGIWAWGMGALVGGVVGAGTFALGLMFCFSQGLPK